YIIKGFFLIVSPFYLFVKSLPRHILILEMLDVGVSIALAVSIIAAIAATIAIRRADRLRESVRRFRGKRHDRKDDNRREDRFPQFRGTRNQVIVTRSDDGHVITLSLPQNIDP